MNKMSHLVAALAATTLGAAMAMGVLVVGEPLGGARRPAEPGGEGRAPSRPRRSADGETSFVFCLLSYVLSHDQHAVAVAEEAVVRADGEGVRGKRALSPSKCAHHHDER